MERHGHDHGLCAACVEFLRCFTASREGAHAASGVAVVCSEQTRLTFKLRMLLASAKDRFGAQSALGTAIAEVEGVMFHAVAEEDEALEAMMPGAEDE